MTMPAKHAGKMLWLCTILIRIAEGFGYLQDHTVCTFGCKLNGCDGWSECVVPGNA